MAFKTGIEPNQDSAFDTYGYTVSGLYQMIHLLEIFSPGQNYGQWYYEVPGILEIEDVCFKRFEKRLIDDECFEKLWEEYCEKNEEARIKIQTKLLVRPKDNLYPCWGKVDVALHDFALWWLDGVRPTWRIDQLDLLRKPLEPRVYPSLQTAIKGVVHLQTPDELSAYESFCFTENARPPEQVDGTVRHEHMLRYAIHWGWPLKALPNNTSLEAAMAPSGTLPEGSQVMPAETIVTEPPGGAAEVAPSGGEADTPQESPEANLSKDPENILGVGFIDSQSSIEYLVNGAKRSCQLQSNWYWSIKGLLSLWAGRGSKPVVSEREIGLWVEKMTGSSVQIPTKLNHVFNSPKLPEPLRERIFSREGQGWEFHDLV